MEKNGKEQGSSDGEEHYKSSSSKEEKEEKKVKKEKKEKKFLSKKIEKEKSEEEERDDIIVGEKEVAFLLDKRKRITVHKFKGQLKVDIREYYEDNGEMKPGKKGISLNNDNWQKLKEFVDKIDEAIDNIK